MHLICIYYFILDPSTELFYFRGFIYYGVFFLARWVFLYIFLTKKEYSYILLFTRFLYDSFFLLYTLSVPVYKHLLPLIKLCLYIGTDGVYSIINTLIIILLEGIMILSIENFLKFSQMESQPSDMKEKVRIKL